MIASDTHLKAQVLSLPLSGRITAGGAAWVLLCTFVLGTFQCVCLHMLHMLHMHSDVCLCVCLYVCACVRVYIIVCLCLCLCAGVQERAHPGACPCGSVHDRDIGYKGGG